MGHNCRVTARYERPGATDDSARAELLRTRIVRLETELKATRGELERLTSLASPPTPPQPPKTTSPRPVVNKDSPAADKLALFRSLFVGRDDAYATRWTSKRTGKSGWSPAVRGGFYTKETSDRDLLPLTDAVIAAHLTGETDRTSDVHVGLYPMASDDTCRLLACDFDDGTWKSDAAAYASACADHDISCVVEISRSGEGAHVWFFFDSSVAGHTARSIGLGLLREAMSRTSTMSLSSYDRLFPAQDLLPRSSPGRIRLGNLIALPLQGSCRRQGTTVFVDSATWQPHEDQFAFLSRIEPLDAARVDSLGASLRPVTVGSRARDSNVHGNDVSLPLIPASRVQMRVDSVVHIPTSGLPAGVITDLKHAASVANPEFYRRQAQRFSTFGTPRYVACFEHDESELRMPRGLVDAASAIMRRHGLHTEVIGDFPAARPIDVSFLGELAPEQKAALDTLSSHDTGVLVAPPGSGKTVMACALIARRGVSTVIVVNRAELLNQWRARLTEFLDLDEKQIGQLGSGRRKRKNTVDLIMLQSVSHRNADPTVLSEYDQVIVDECHALGAPSTEAAIRRVRARYWVGLTATPYRADQMDDLITMQCGPIRHEIERSETRSRELVIHITDFTTAEDGMDGPSIQAIYTELAADALRNDLIVAGIAGAVDEGRTVLALTNRIEHLNLVSAGLEARGIRHHTLHGRKSAAERAATMKMIRSSEGEPFVVVAIDKLAGEGLDIPALDTLFLMMPVSFKGRVVQQLGRVTRLTRASQLPAQVHDYHDANVPLFDRMHRRRRRVIEKEGFALTRDA